jgi:hypothetical protein
MSDFTKCVKLCVVGALVSGQVYAVDPVLNKQVPQDGVTYTLMNLAQPNQYMMRTSGMVRTTLCLGRMLTEHLLVIPT